jgi:hypothetical protein
MTYSKNAFLTLQEMTVNAQYILTNLLGKGWSKESVCGMLGNMETESTINPGIWQSLDEGNMSMGFGLVQWTPASKYTNWADSNGYSWGDINGQLHRLQYEIDNGVQWIATSSYNLSFQQFKTNATGLSVEDLAQAFLLNYERPADQTQPDRSTQARYWFDTLDGEGSGICVQLAQFPMDMILVTQGENGSFSHTNRWAMDFVGTTDVYPYYAPFDIECIGRNNSEAILIWKSQNEVMCADGTIRNVIFRTIHDCALLYNVGAKVSKGTLIGHTGNCGNSAGDHLHLDAFSGTEYVDPYTNKLHIYDVFAVNGVDIVDGFGYDWKTSDYEDCSNGGGGDTPGKKNNLIPLLLCDALNGWKY